MRKNRPSKFLFLLLFALLSFGKGYASHFGAADIWVKYVGTAANPLRYEIHLNVYRACEPSQSLLSGTDNVTISQTLGCSPTGTDTSWTVQVDTVVGDGSDTLDQLCSGFKSLNSCRQPTSVYPGFNRFNYVALVDLPYRCTDWHFVWTNSARNAGVKNLCQPASSYAITIDAHLNNQFANTSSPQFTVDPIPYVCINQPAQFFNGPYDPDGDSLVVTNVQPWGCTFTPCAPGCGPNTEIPYDPGIPPGGIPYTLADPIQSIVTPYVVDPLTGIATFTPSLTGKFVIAFRCDKYDHVTKTFMGSTRRDVQVSVLACASPAPNIDTIPQTVSGGLLDSASSSKGMNVIYVCPNTPVSFTMRATARTGSTAVYLGIDTSNSNTPGNTFSVPNNGTQVVDGTYNWTPGDTSVGVHTIVFSSVDSSCTIQQPVVQQSYLVVTIKVITGINAIPKIFRDCPLSTAPTILNVVGMPAGFVYDWEEWVNKNSLSSANIINHTSADPQIYPKDTTTYIVFAPGLLAGPNCKVSDTVTVNVDTSNHIKIQNVSPIILCQKQTIHLDAIAYGNLPTSNISCGVPIGAFDTSHPDSTVFVPLAGAYAGSINANNSCSPFAANGSAHHQYLLRAADLINSSMISGVMTALTFYVRTLPASGTYDSVTLSLGCTPVNSLPNDGSFLAGVTPVYTNPSLVVNTLGALRLNFNSPYAWDTSQNLIVDICYSNPAALVTVPPSFDFYSTGYPSTTLAYSDLGNVCTGAVTALSGGNPEYAVPAMQFSYYDAPTVAFPYTWKIVYGSNFFSDTTAQSPIAFINSSSRYYVLSRGKSGCAFRDSIDVYLDPVRFPSITPADTTVCSGIGAQLVASYTQNGYQWYQNGFNPTIGLSCSNCQTTIATLDTTTSFEVVFTDTLNCKDTAYANVKVVSLPVFKIVNNDTTIKIGSSIQLSVNTGNEYQYVWNPPASLDNPYLYNPTATPIVPTVYSVIAYNQFCSGYDTVKVGIDYRSNLFVPSAFTPNGDGKNDLFRVSNITYEKIIEFRVFNRWGQEIYSATDNKGWDGTSNGVLNDIGIYNYLIRVVYPDGVEKNFTGSVTLIR